jgi:hypothetical protein
MHPHEPMSSSSSMITGCSDIAALAEKSSPLAQHVSSNITAPMTLLCSTCGV